MGDIFISCSRTDTDYARKLAENLQSRGLHIWIDERLDDRARWPRKLKKRLDASDAFIVIMTPNSFASERVQSELKHAKQRLKPIFPLWLEGAEPWLSGDLTQYYDVRREQLPEAHFYSALEQAVAIRRLPAAPLIKEEPVSTTTHTAPSLPRSTTRTVNVIIRLVAIAFLLGAILFNKSAAQQLLNVSTAASLDAEILPTAAALLQPTANPGPALLTRTYQISLCCGYPGMQRSGRLNFLASVQTAGKLQLEFNMENDLSACSDMYLHILWDDGEIYKTDPIGPLSGNYSTGLLDLSSRISRGSHVLTISPEGIEGGCNAGGLPDWEGTLTVTTSTSPK